MKLDYRLARIRNRQRAVQIHNAIKQDGELTLRMYTVADLRKLAVYHQVLIGKYDRKDDIVKKLIAYYQNNYKGFESTFRYAQH